MTRTERANRTGESAAGQGKRRGFRDGPAWSDEELSISGTGPHANPEKAEKVRRMFGAIAARYDLNNRLHSLGRDVAWRREAVRAAGVRAGDVVVDVACGTGDLTQEFARTAAAKVVGIDFTREMLDIAETKRDALREREERAGTRGDLGWEKVSYVEGDAMNLSLPGACADIVSIAFGIRNVAEPARALREFARILKPGGRLVILEFGKPRNAVLRWLNDVYTGWVMPRTATLISGDRSGAYRYLPKSVGTFAGREELMGMMEAAGFGEVSARGMTLGVCVLYLGVRR